MGGRYLEPYIRKLLAPRRLTRFDASILAPSREEETTEDLEWSNALANHSDPPSPLSRLRTLDVESDEDDNTAPYFYPSAAVAPSLSTQQTNRAGLVQAPASFIHITTFYRCELCERTYDHEQTTVMRGGSNLGSSTTEKYGNCPDCAEVLRRSRETSGYASNRV